MKCIEQTEGLRVYSLCIIMTSHSEFGVDTTAKEVAKAFGGQIGGKTGQHIS